MLVQESLKSNLRNKAREYSIYVIELEREAGPRGLQLPPLYVGQTAHSPDHRFGQHKEGGRLANTKVARFGVRLRPDLFAHIPKYTSRADAELAEAETARRLEMAGYRVFCG